jgi:hypothetical protein
MQQLLTKIEDLEKKLASLKRFIGAHHPQAASECDACRTLNGLAPLIDKKQYCRLFDMSNMLKQVDSKRASQFSSDIRYLCQVKQYQDITLDQWGEVEKILLPLELEMRQLGIQPIKPWLKK